MADLRIVAYDLSLTSTGAASRDRSGIGMWLIESGKLQGPERLGYIREYVMGDAIAAHLVVLEGYSYGSQGRALFQIGELGGVIRLALWEAGIPYVEVSPAELKKYATGKGNAKKLAVYQAAIRRADMEFETDDTADAWWLLQMALAAYGLPHVPMPKANAEVLSKVPWPKLEVLEVPV